MTSHDEIVNAAFSWLNEHFKKGQTLFNRDELLDFSFQGKRLGLVDRQKGIHVISGSGFAISITTTNAGNYNDRFNDSGQLLYHYQGTDPNLKSNIALKNNYKKNIPLIYFRQIQSDRRYECIYPVLVVNADDLKCEVTIDLFDYGINTNAESQMETLSNVMAFEEKEPSLIDNRSYSESIRLNRNHQAFFRKRVLTAYSNKCSICKFAHPELLQAGHIIPDRDSKGVAEVYNGISLCSIHHLAFDRNFIGIDPNYDINVNKKLLDEIDGPMLQHGFKDFHHKKIFLPTEDVLKPNKAFLEKRFEEFKSAS